MKNSLFRSLASRSIGIISKFGKWLRLIRKQVLRRLYFSKFIQKRTTIYTRRLVLAFLLKIYFFSFKNPFQTSKRLSVTRTHSVYMMWLQKERGLAKRPVLFPNRLLPIRLKVNEEYAPLELQENKRFRLPLIYYVPFLALYLIYGSRPHEMPVVGAYFPTPTITSTSQNVGFLLPEMRTPTVTPTSRTSYLLLPTLQTPTSEFSQHQSVLDGFPYITNYGDWYMSGQRVKFSYYYPPLGGVNCHEDNWVNGQCKNITASGKGWKEYMGKGLAVHPDMLSILPFGSTVYVVNPEPIRGFYTVIDLCGGCFINGNYYFDFLFERMPDGLNWSYDVDFLPIRVGWDGTFPPTATPVINTLAPTATATPHYIIITSTPQPTYTPFPTYTVFPTVTPEWTDTPVPTVTP